MAYNFPFNDFDPTAADRSISLGQQSPPNPYMNFNNQTYDATKNIQPGDDYGQRIAQQQNDLYRSGQNQLPSYGQGRNDFPWQNANFGTNLPQDQQNTINRLIGQQQGPQPAGPDQSIFDQQGLARDAWERQLDPRVYDLMVHPEKAAQLGFLKGDVAPLGSPDAANRPGNGNDWNNRYFWLANHQQDVLNAINNPMDMNSAAAYGTAGRVKWDQFNPHAYGAVNANRLPTELQGQVNPQQMAELQKRYYYQTIPGLENLGDFNDPAARGQAVQELYKLSQADPTHDYYFFNNGGNASIVARGLQNPGNQPPPMPAPRGYAGGGGYRGGGGSAPAGRGFFNNPTPVHPGSVPPATLQKVAGMIGNLGLNAINRGGINQNYTVPPVPLVYAPGYSPSPATPTPLLPNPAIGGAPNNDYPTERGTAMGNQAAPDLFSQDGFGGTYVRDGNGNPIYVSTPAAYRG